MSITRNNDNINNNIIIIIIIECLVIIVIVIIHDWGNFAYEFKCPTRDTSVTTTVNFH